jgi:hypothetical protein
MKHHKDMATFAGLDFTNEEWGTLEPLIKHCDYYDIGDLVDMAHEDVIEGVNSEIAMRLAFPIFKAAMIRKLLDDSDTEEASNAN